MKSKIFDFVIKGVSTYFKSFIPYGLCITFVLLLNVDF